ncbi:hypothetical protein FRC06_006140 [Ceratobasidium sp. 370]|nr:hypothetical protein FRC06_006140 [Ceratobasidium sp. 370]
MSAWNGPGKTGTGGSPEFVHVDAAGTSPSDKSSAASAQKPKPSSSNQRGRGGSQANGSSSSSNSASNWQAAIGRLLDTTKPEDATAIRRLGEDVRAGGTNGARAVVELLRLRIGEKNATAETRLRAIAIARVLAQRSVSGADAQRLIAAPPFVATLKQAASDPNVRGSLKTWASQIRIGDPNDASMLTPITGLDEHLAQAAETASQSSESNRRPPLNPSGSSSFVAHPPPNEDPDEDSRTGVRVHTTGNRNTGEPIANGGAFNASMPVPGGFGLDGSTFDGGPSIVAAGPGGLPTVREFPASMIQPLPPSMGVPPRQNFGNTRAGWGDEDDGVQSDAPSTRSRRTTAQVMQGAFGVTPSMDGGREARDRINERSTRNGNGRGRSTRTSSLADGTVSESEEPSPRGRHPGIPAMIPEDNRVYGQRVPAPMPMSTQQRGRSRHPSVSPDRSGFRSRSQSPTTTGRSRMRSRSRAQSRRRGAGSGVDPAAVLVNLAGVQFVRVVQEYYAAREGELTLREGEVLAVIRREEGGRFWLGHSQGQVGRFPTDVVELLSHQRDPAAQEEKTAELLRRSREIDDFMDQLHEFDITRYCITEDKDIQTDLSALLGLRNELVRHLDETTTGMGRLKAMLNKIKEAQRVHDRMIDSRIAGYTARSSLHDATPRNHYQELPPNPIQYAPFDMSQYMRRTAAAQQIEQPPPAQSPPLRQQPQIGMYNNNPAAALRFRQAQEMGYAPRSSAPARARTYSYTPAAPPPHVQAPARRMDDEQSSAYISSEPTTPGETSSVPPAVGAAPVNGGVSQYAFPVQQNGGERWGEPAKDADQDAGRQRGRGSHVPSESSAHTHAPRRGGF